MTSNKQRIEKIEAGALSREQLTTLRSNAIAKGGNEDLVAACDRALAQIARSKGKGQNGPDHVVAEKRPGYSIMASGMDSTGKVTDERLVPIAEAISKHSSVDDVAILKTQIRFYFKGHHMVCGVAAKGGYFIGVLNEQKLTDATVKAWEGIGPIGTGTYFNTKYLNVVVPRLEDLASALASTNFAV